MERELSNMPPKMIKSEERDLRATASNPQHKEKKTKLKKVKSLKSGILLSDRKREYSLTSTKIPEPNNPPVLTFFGSLHG